MTHEQLEQLARAARLAKDAHAALTTALEGFRVPADSGRQGAQLGRWAAITATNVETAGLYLDLVRETLRSASCDRRPCDRAGGICPRCR